VNAQLQQLERQFTGFIEARIKEQWLLLEQVWEPKITNELTNMAELCQQALARLVKTQGRLEGVISGAAWQGRFIRACDGIVQDQLKKAKAHLLDLVLQEAQGIGEILTVNGLAGRVPRPDLAALETAPWADRLAGGAALEQSVRKSYTMYVRRVLASLDEIQDPRISHQQLKARLEPIKIWWQNHLHTIGVTMVNAVFSRTQQAVQDHL
jgi:hypothetical protein